VGTQVFEWDPLTEPTGDVDFAVVQAKFGDGYTQTAAEGINNRSESWPLTFRGTKEYIGAIRSFLDWHGGYKSFFYTPPGGDPGLYMAPKYSPVVHAGERYDITVTFQQVFRP
jgi:phage-related protein